MRTTRVWMVLISLWGSGLALGQPISAVSGIRATLRPISYRIPQGLPVWIRYTIENTTKEPITLTVPGSTQTIPSPRAGLPIEHVFSGGSGPSLSVTTPAGRKWEEPTGYKFPDRAPVLMLAPHGSVGTTMDLRDYYPSLRGAGQFRISWYPYGGSIGTETVVITIAPLKRAQIVTNEGQMTLRFFYSEAPLHVDNFIDLVESGFYNGKTYHRIEPGYLVQGGCPRGDGTGIRPDGKRIPAEFNGHILRKGSVAMALLDDDADSASSQFFICNTRQKDWDGRYTVFAELVGQESFDTLDRLMAVKIDDKGRPLSVVTMHTVRLINAPMDDLP